MRTISLPLLAAWWVCSCLLAPGMVTEALPVQLEKQASIEKLAQYAAERPFKLDVRPLTQGSQLGGKVSVEIVLLDAANRRVASSQKSDLRVEVTVTGPSKKVKTYLLLIKPGEKVGTLTFEPPEAGVLSLKAREVNDTLLPGGNSVLVRKPVSFRPAPPARSVGLLRAAFHVEEPQARVVAAELAEPVPRQATLLLQDSTGREILADGKDAARIQVFFVDPKGEAAPADIKVWLKWSNGQMTPQPLVIKKGEFLAEAQWISRSSLEATASVSSSAPNYPIDGTSELKVTFAPPIHMIGFLTSNPLSLSLVDYAPIQVGFFTLADDGTLKPITTSKVRRVTLTPLDGLLRVNPLHGDVLPNQSGIPFFVAPAWFGAAALQVSTPDYPMQKLNVQVTGLLVVILCVVGGVLGGLATKQSLKASTLWRVFVGILGAIGLVWFSVFSVLPLTFSLVAHNPVSVFVVGIVGGYGGTRVLDFLGKKLGYL